LTHVKTLCRDSLLYSSVGHPRGEEGHNHGPGGIMEAKDIHTTQEQDILNARDTLHLLLLEFGDIHIETLGQLLRLTHSAEQEYSRICVKRVCR